MLTHAIIERTAHIAWSPKFQNEPYVACGTAKSKSNSFLEEEKESSLEIFDLSSDKPTHLVSVNVPSQFSRILWTSTKGSGKDIIIGGFEDGHVEFWDSQGLLDSRPNSLISTKNIHSGPVKGLEKSRFQPNLIVTGATNSEIALWDLNSIEKASILGIKKSLEFKNVSDIAWNARTAHIIAAASDSGIVSILDLRNNKEVMALSIAPEISISSIAWNPLEATSIASASETDSSPFVYSWDLRNNSEPKSIFKGHKKGIMSLAWCSKDAELMVSSGRDYNVLCWNPNSNEIINEFSHNNEVFEVQWTFNDNQNIFSSADFDGNVHFRVFPPSLSASIETASDFELKPPVPKSEESVHNQEVITQNTSSVVVNSENENFICRKSGASFGGSNICSIFNSFQKAVFLLKPDFVQLEMHKLNEFESLLQSEGVAGVCENQLQNSDLSEELELVWRLIKCLTLQEQERQSEVLEVLDLYRDDKNQDRDNFEDDLVNKIICSDIEGAVEACINSDRFADALLLSSLPPRDENELQRKTEDIFVNQSNSFYLRIAQAIRRAELTNIINSAPLEEWKVLIKLICIHSPSYETQEVLSNILLKRFVDGTLEDINPIGFLLVLTCKAEDFINFVLKSKINPRSSDNLSFSSLLQVYMILRASERLFPDFFMNLTDEFVKVSIFEVFLKMFILTKSYCFINDRTVMFMRSVYENNFKGINTNLDIFMENEFNFDNNYHSNILSLANETENSTNATSLCQNIDALNFNCSQNLLASASVSYSEQPYNNYYNNYGYSQNTQLMPNTSSVSATSIPTATATATVTSSPLPTKTYNDAPIISPRLPNLNVCESDLELSASIIETALQNLYTESSRKASAHQVRIVKDCNQKLSVQLIRSKQYSTASKFYIKNLFDNFNANNFDQSTAKIISTLLLTHYEEVKDWILLVKRLQDICKNN